MNRRAESKPKWIRFDDDLLSAIEDEQIRLQRQAAGAKISFSDAARSLLILGIRSRQKPGGR